MSNIEKFFLKIGSIDRRWIFIIIALVVVVPLLVPIGLPIRATDTSKSVYDAVEALPKGSKVLLSIEYSPSTKPENHPMAISIMRHLFRNDHKVYVTCLWPDGQFMAQDALNQVAVGEFDKKYGKDYVLLGYRPGGEAVVKGIVSNIRKLFSVDARQTKIDDIPMMDDITNFKDFDFLFSASAGYPGERHTGQLHQHHTIFGAGQRDGATQWPRQNLAFGLCAEPARCVTRSVAALRGKRHQSDAHRFPAL